jgi:replicative DNA helicase
MQQGQSSQASHERLPPQAPDVERTVLGSMMIDSIAVETAMQHLDEGVFYASAHNHIFACMKEMADKNVPIDIITLSEALRKKGLLDAVGGTPYLSQLAESVATSANVEYYARILVDKATLRSLISTSAEITTDCFRDEKEPKQVLDDAESRIFSISEARIATSFQSIGQLLPKTFEEIEQYGKGGINGVPTGFTLLDELTTGLQRSDLVIVAGRPSMGKTALALSIALNAAVKGRKAVAIFSLEMSKEQVVQRMLCAEARVNMHQLRSGKLPKRDFPKLSIAAGPLAEAPIFVDDTPAISVLEIRAKARRLKRQGNLDLIMIDYLQLMNTSTKAENRQQEISQISRSLKGLAKELAIPVVALSQLSRAVETRGGDKRPQLADLRESGAIEQDADVVMFVYRGEYYFPDDENLRGKAELIIGKQRNGPTDTVQLSFIREFARFENLSLVPEGGEF